MAITNDFFTALNDPKAAMWSAGVAFNRSNPLPLDKWSVFQTMDEAVAYAEGNAVAYPGQLIAVYDAEAGVMTACILQESAEGKLEPVAVGTTPVGDESTIVVAEDGTVSLAGVSGLAFTETSEGGEEVEVTYQPLLTADGLIWVKPSATTVEGLATELEGLKSRVGAVETAVGNVYTKEEADSKFAPAEDYATQTELDEAVGELQGNIDAVNDKIGEVAEGKTVVQMISDAKAEASYDDTELAGRVTAAEGEIDDLQAKDIEIEGNVTAINTKIGEVAEGKTVVGMIADAQAAATYDDTELAGRVTANEEAIATLNGDGEGSVNKKVADKVTAEIDAFATKISDDGTVNTFKELVDYVAEHSPEAADMAADITELYELVGDESVATQISAQVSDKAKQSDLDAAVLRIEANEGDIADLKGLVGESSVADQIATGIAGKVDAEEGKGLSSNDFTDELLAKVEGVEAGAQVNKIESVDEAQFGLDEQKHLTLLDIAMGKVTGLTDALAGKVAAEEGKRLMTDAEGAKLEGIAAGAQVNAIDAVDEAQFAIGEGKKLTLLDIAMGKVTGLQSALDGKADKGTTLAAYGITDAYTKTETEGRIQEVLDGLSDTSETAASVSQALETYKTANDARVLAAEENIAKKVDAEEGKSLVADTLIAKLEAIEAGAQVNKIESVKVGDTLLEIVEKTVVIPVGAGLKASEEITISEDGSLGIGQVNVNKLVQDANDFLILNGGAAN